MSEPLDFTGERFTPECVREIRYEHFHRYALAAEWVKGLTVLDAACGEGYGSHLLSAHAAKVTGIDVSSAAIAHAESRYAAANLEFSVADCCATPFPDSHFDCVISFETLEHLHSQRELLAEFRRVLKPEGFLAISTPDKAVYSDKLGNQNPYHVQELYRHEFEKLLAEQFSEVRLLGQKLGFHSMIWPMGADSSQQYQMHQESGNVIETLQQPSSEPVYLLAICANSAAALPTYQRGLFLFDDESESVYSHYNHEIRKNLQAGAILQDLENRLGQLQAELAAARSPFAESSQPTSQKHWLGRMLQKLKG